MTLRRKTVAVVGTGVLSLFLVFYFISSRVIFKGFSAVEENEIRQEGARAKNFLQEQLHAMLSQAIDWARWDDTYAFVRDRSQAYIDSNLKPESIDILNADYMLFLGPASEVVYAAPNTKRTGDERLRRSIEAAVSADAVQRSGRSEYHGVVAAASSGIWLVAAATVQRSDGTAMTGARVVLARLLDAALLSRFSDVLAAQLALFPLSSPAVSAAQRNELKEGRLLPLYESSDTAAALVPVADTAGASGAVLLVRIGRDIYHEGLKLYRSSLASLIALAFISLLLTLLLLERCVIRRLRNFDYDIVRIRKSLNLEDRINVTGKDELAAFASHLNELIDALHASQQQLAEKTARLEAEITERERSQQENKELEEQLRQAQKMESLGRLAGGIAHDFNNILSGIMGYADLASAELPAEDTLRRDLEEIRKAGEQGSLLTAQLLAFSRREPACPITADVNRVVRSCEPLLRRLLCEDIELRVSFCREKANVRIDHGQLEQVLLNLAANARDAMPNGGTLAIAVTVKNGGPDGSWMELTFADTGEGMNEETRKHIFEPFFTTKEDSKGTGLGLAIVYGIVSRNGGRIVVESAPGAGTAFRVYLPISDEPETAAKAYSAEPLPTGTETVIVVEDENRVLNLAARILSNQGYHVLPAREGLEALSLLDALDTEVHLLLTDVVMPRMNGKELSQKVRAKSPGTKVLFMSGYTSEIVADHGIDQGLSFVQKPFAAAALVRKVRQVLDGPTN